MFLCFRMHEDATQIKVPHSHFDGEQNPNSARSVQLRNVTQK